MREQFYLTKSIDPNDVEEANSDSEKKFLGYITIDIATTHKDRVGDVLTKRFIDDAVKSLLVNNAFFYNHKTMEDPIGKVVQASAIPLSDGEYSARLKVGISKTATKQWELVKEGILNKGSIGFYLDPDGYEYDEENDTLIIDKGEVVEGSLVGVPANGKASLIDVSKRLKAIHKEKLTQEEQPITETKGDNMNEEEMKQFIAEQFASIQKGFEAQTISKEAEFEKKLEAHKDEFAKALEESEARAKALEEERNEFRKALEEGRKTSGGNSENENKDPYFLKNEDLALKKGFYEIGKLIKNGQPFAVDLIPSSEVDLFKE